MRKTNKSTPRIHGNMSKVPLLERCFLCCICTKTIFILFVLRHYAPYVGGLLTESWSGAGSVCGHFSSSHCQYCFGVKEITESPPFPWHMYRNTSASERLTRMLKSFICIHLWGHQEQRWYRRHHLFFFLIVFLPRGCDDYAVYNLLERLHLCASPHERTHCWGLLPLK